VYGLLARLDDAQAYRRIFEIKQRPASQHIQLLDVRGSTLAEAMLKLTAGARPGLAGQFQAGTATLVVPADALAGSGITGRIMRVQPGSVGVRLPSHPELVELLRRLCGPVWATSANTTGTPPPNTDTQVRQWLAGLELPPRLAVVENAVRQGQASDVWMLEDSGWHRLR
jgi:L-threonylcarbamoyladenylate synthase